MNGIEQESSANLALVRLLVRLNLLKTELPLGDRFPIARAASAGFFLESEAIKRVSAALKIRHHSIDNALDPKLLSLFNDEPISRVHLSKWQRVRAIPVAKSEHSIVIAMANPLDIESIASLEFELDCKIDVTIGVESEILSVIAHRTNSTGALEPSAFPVDWNPPKIRNEGENQSTHQESTVFNEDLSFAPVVHLVNKIFTDAVHRDATDIHLTPEKDHLSVRTRTDGIMTPLTKVENKLKNAVVSRVKMLAGMDITEKRKPQDGRLRLKTAHGNKDLRISTVPASHGENVVIRVLSSDLHSISLESLGMKGPLQERFRQVLKRSSKVVLVTGPTGSGKTSTLYASLLSIHDGTQNIITLEEPVEYRIPGITQIQVNPKIGLSFAHGLRSVLRQDPNIILVGEIRDEETANVVMQVSQTGHLILSTLHTNSSAAAVTRLRDLKIPAYVIASSVGCILAQRLVRKFCDQCALPASEETKTRFITLGLSPDNAYEPHGCEKCENTGFKGRLSVYSLLDVTDTIAEAIRNDKSEDEIEHLARKEGFRSLEEEALELVSEGITSLEEVERVIGPLQTILSKKLLSKGQNNSGEKIILKRKLIIVEDDDDVRFTLRLLFEQAMFEVIEAKDGLDGLEKIYKDPPDVIVSDVMMPKMDGLKMLHQLRADPRMTSFPVLMLTANNSEDNELKLMRGGASDFVAKTANPEILIARVNRLLQR